MVGKNQDNEGRPEGYKLGKKLFIVAVGQVIKLGRIEYFISEICSGGEKYFANSKNSQKILNRKTMIFDPNDPK